MISKERPIRTKGQFQAKLDALNSGKLTPLPDLTKAYSDIWDRNMEGQGNLTKLAIKALQWLLQCQRPLTTHMLFPAITADEEDSLAQDVSISDVLALCNNFVLVKTNHVVGFAHLSVREFLESKKVESDDLETPRKRRDHCPFIPARAHAQIATSCFSFSNKFDPKTGSRNMEEFISNKNYETLSDVCSRWLVAFQPYGLGDLDSSIEGEMMLFSYAAFKVGWHRWMATKNTADAEIPKFSFWSDFYSRHRISKMLQERIISQLWPIDHPLISAVKQFSSELACLFLQAGFDPNEKDSEGTSLLHFTSANALPGSPIVPFMELLLQAGADIASEDNKGNSVLITAVKSKNLEIVERLARISPQLLDHQNQDGETPLHAAIWRFQHFTIRFLAEAGANASIKHRKNEETPLHIAALLASLRWSSEWVETIDSLLRGRYEVNVTNEDGKTPLHKAALLGLSGPAGTILASKLVRAGFDPKATDHTGTTPLDIAKLGSQELMDALLLRGDFASVL